ncbi:MAG: aldose 1-epimerase family protein [Candidatus Humimicrobiaceae bacterium]
MKLFGKEMSQKEIMDRIGDISQLGGIKSYELNDGSSRGVRAIDIKTAAGLDMTVAVDRCLDISYLSYKSVPISWRSAMPITHPSYFESKWDEWLRNFYGGLFTTCGFTYAGSPCIDEGIELNIHGRAANLPGYNVCSETVWEDNTFKFHVSGKVREVKHGGEKIELSRKITTIMDEPRIIIEDRIKNIGSVKSPLMMLYHFNIGYPIISETSELVEPEADISTKDDISKNNSANFKNFASPTQDCKDELFFHDIEPDSKGYGNIAIVNEKFNDGEGIGIWLKYKKDTLPNLTQWKLLRSGGEYVCGLEPGNNFVTTRAQARAEGTLNYILPDEEKTYKLEFAVLKNNADIKKFKAEVIK